MSRLSSDGEEVTNGGESGAPVETEPGSVVAPTQVDGELIVGISEGEEAVVVEEKVLVGTVSSLNFAVVPGSGDTDQFVPDAIVCQGDIQSAGLVRMKAIGKLKAIVRLDTVDGERKEEHHLFEELDGGEAAELIEDHLKLHAAILVNGGVLVELLPRQST